jgi:glycosyltransferase involved in cell wall biosynthesis
VGAGIVIRVTHIIAGLDSDGAEKMLQRLIAGMDSSRFENEVISLTGLGPMARQIEACGVRVRALGMKRGSANPFYLLKLAAWLRKSQPHVIQTWMYHADLIGGLAARLAGRSGVVWNIRHSELHPETDKRSTVWTGRVCARLSRQLPRRIVCCSETSRKFHSKFGYAADRMQVILNGFDLHRFRSNPRQRAEVREALGIPQSAPVVGLIARKHPVKDHRNFMQAAGLLHREFPEVQFVLCGEGVTFSDPELLAWAQSAGIQNVCHLLGQRDDVPRILNAFDIATSSSSGEAFPNAVAEAMACGVPCVVTDVGDSGFIVDQTGRVVAPRDPSALAQGWKELLEAGPEVRRDLGVAARERVEQHFGLAAVIGQYQDLYTQVSQETSAKGPSHARSTTERPHQTLNQELKNSLHPRARVLFVDNDVNSFFSYRIEMARAARDAGFEVHIAAPEGKAAETLVNEGFRFHAVPMTRSGLHPWKELATIAALFRLYRKLRPDLVHHLRLKPVLYGGLAAYGARVPAVAGLLTGLGYVFIAETRKAVVIRKLVTLSCKVAFRHANQRIIFQNPDDQLVFVQNKLLAAGQTVLIKGSGVDVNEYLPTPERGGVPVVVLASRMLRDKGVDEFVEAARNLRAARVTARFVLVGETDPGNPTAITAEQLRQWADSGVVEWWGHQANMKDVLAQAHVVCLPSLREGVPKVLIEAAACGRAIVTTDAPGCREIVRNGENGLLVPVRDSRALAEALRLLIESAPLRAGMGLKGRDIAVQEFSIERVVRETLGVYRDLLANGSRSSRELNVVEQQAR